MSKTCSTLLDNAKAPGQALGRTLQQLGERVERNVHVGVVAPGRTAAKNELLRGADRAGPRAAGGAAGVEKDTKTRHRAGRDR
jgi:hypothetical protein